LFILGDLLVAFFVNISTKFTRAVILAPDGTPYRVNGNNFGHGQTTIVIPADCTHDNMLIMYSTALKFHCTEYNSGFTFLCISSPTMYPNIGMFVIYSCSLEVSPCVYKGSWIYIQNSPQAESVSFFSWHVKYVCMFKLLSIIYILIHEYKQMEAGRNGAITQTA
jgi:hypothetical protein